jgi:hypothetical protein
MTRQGSNAADDDRSAEFASVWAALDQAQELNKKLNQQWSQACDDSFDANVTTFPDRRGEITVHVDWPPETI